MVFIKARNKQLLLTGSLAVAVTAFTVTACGGAGTASPAQGAAPGQWTRAEVSQFTAAGGGAGGGSENSCIIGYFEQDMSFGNAMAVVSVDPASDASMSLAQIEAALVSKYGTTEGDAINAQFEQVATDAGANCSGTGLHKASPVTALVAGPFLFAGPSVSELIQNISPAAQPAKSAI